MQQENALIARGDSHGWSMTSRAPAAASATRRQHERQHASGGKHAAYTCIKSSMSLFEDLRRKSSTCRSHSIKLPQRYSPRPTMQMQCQCVPVCT